MECIVASLAPFLLQAPPSPSVPPQHAHLLRAQIVERTVQIGKRFVTVEAVLRYILKKSDCSAGLSSEVVADMERALLERAVILD
jgi:hypothetical protein